MNVGALRAQAGDDQGAEACYRAGAEGGESLGWVNLAYLLCDKPGREAEAEVAYRAAIEAGHDEWNYLAGLLHGQPGREAGAEAAYRAAAEPDWLNLAILLHGSPDRTADAEVAYRQALAGGDTRAWEYLGDLLRHAERAEDAEAAYREALAAGHAGAYDGLLRLLIALPERRAEAIEAARGAVGHGAEGAELRLGGLLLADGQEQEALLAYEAAVAAGDERAWTLLAGIIVGDGDTSDPADVMAQLDRSPELEERYREDEDWVALGQLLVIQGRYAEAEESLRLAAYEGELQALQGVALMLGAQRPDGGCRARPAPRRLGGDAVANTLLGALLLSRGARDDAAAAFTAAVDSGFSDAERGLALLRGEALWTYGAWPFRFGPAGGRRGRAARRSSPPAR